LDELITVAKNLSRNPERGSCPKERVALGIREYRQIAGKTYRATHRIAGNRVIIYRVADGRRDMPSALARRLLGA
jgi:toxin ParE1/3/4